VHLLVVLLCGCAVWEDAPQSVDLASAPAADLSEESEKGDALMWKPLFDGTLTSKWKMSTIQNQPGQDDPGHFTVEDGALVAHPGTDLGLLWLTEPSPADFVLELEWRRSAENDNSGVFLRFPDLDSRGYNNTAWVAINFGFEIQIDETGAPDGKTEHTTGAVYSVPNQVRTPKPALPIGQWNQFRLVVRGQTYDVFLNGDQVTHFENQDATRGHETPNFIGVQTHTGNVAYRAIRMAAL
jgi:hypothetical protein